MVTQLYLHVYILFSHIIVLQHKWLDIFLSATQQDLFANPFQRQLSASINPKIPIHPTPSPPPWQLQVYSTSPWFSFLWKSSFVLYISYQIWVTWYGICLSLSFFFYFFFLLNFIFPLYSKGIKLSLHVYIFPPPFVLLQYEYLDIVLNATQQDLLVNLF